MTNFVCFYHSKINVSVLSPHICTHIIYTSIGLDFDGNIAFPYLDQLQVLNELNFLDKMRANNENLKILISFNDCDENQRRAFNAMLSSSINRKRFSKNVIGFIKKCNLDGIDLNWQNPHPQHTANFVDLIRRLKELMGGLQSYEINSPEIFDIYRFDDTVDPHILSLTLNATAVKCYDLKHISKKAKFINLVTFDLRDPSVEKFSMEYAVNVWLAEGAIGSKLNITAATHGCNSAGSMREKAVYAKYGGFGGLAIHSFDGDDYTKGYPVIRAAYETFEKSRVGFSRSMSRIKI